MNARTALPDIASTVRTAWTGVVDAPFDSHQAWEDTGADSLQAMHLLLALETALGARLSFDLIGPATTPTSLAQSLEGRAVALPRDALPTVFLLPGLFGDEPRFAAFRRAFDGRMRFELIDHPGLDEPAAVTSRLSATGAFVADAIEALAPTGELRVAGYSFGGGVAFEAAHCLRMRGREVVMLGILDLIMRDPSVAEPRHGWKHRLIARIAEIDRLRVPALAIIGRMWPGKLAQTRREMIAHLRVAAMRSWKPRTIAVPTLCAMSLETVAYQEAQWPGLCADLRSLLRLPVGHLEIFDSESMALLAPAFDAAVAAATISTSPNLPPVQTPIAAEPAAASRLSVPSEPRAFRLVR